MDFRWVAAIAVWTMLSGPVFVGLQSSAPVARSRSTVSSPAEQAPRAAGRPAGHW
jgi:hypothetical protein